MFTGKDIPAEKRWYVIGAHQAGASERQCARLSGLSKTAVHGIIKTFTETGSPLSSRQQQHGQNAGGTFLHLWFFRFAYLERRGYMTTAMFLASCWICDNNSWASSQAMC
jgi:hypothetical protein